MLDNFSIFTKGGVLLWTLHHAAVAASAAAAATANSAAAAAVPQAQLDAVNALVRTVLLEERSGEASYTHTPRQGPAQTLKWVFHNGLDLVFVAGYQKSLPLLYVDPLLAAARDEFAGSFYDAAKGAPADYAAFGKRFDALQRAAEARADAARRAAGDGPSGKALGGGGAAAAAAVMAVAAGAAAVSGKNGAAGDEDEEDAADAKQRQQQQQGQPQVANGGGGGGGAFDLSRLKAKLKGSKEPAPAAASGKSVRKWGPGGGRTEAEAKLDYSAPPPTAGGGGGAAAAAGAGGGRSRMDDENALLGGGAHDDDLEEREAAAAALEAQGAGGAASAAAAAAAPRGVLGSFVQSLALRVAGSSALTREDLDPALQDMRRKLMERNVAEGIAAQVVDSVARSLVGRRLATFTGVGALVRGAFEDAVSGVLNKRSADVLLEARRARERGRPYVVVFCGVNGVGKSTNLAKIAYWLGQHGLKVTLAACDTFRAGAVEQLKTHAARLGVPLYERGYERDPAKVAREAVRQAARDGRDVVLVDTAGRMQDNEPLMRALANLIAVNAPDLVLFVGEALVGNDAVDQLVKFSRALADLAPPSAAAAGGGGGAGGGGEGAGAGGGGRPARAPGIDGIVLTKFDTIDDKVGAALSMTYTSGAPILFVGCGQTYQDLTRLNAKAVVRALLR